MPKHANHWWPLCFSETITSTTPTALFWGTQELAVFRDKNEDIRAVEDRCPHRRAPLSLGRITDNGHIQCGYHGWTFNGETGDISGFPNLDEGERLPKCGIKAFDTYEHQGVVYITDTESDATPTGLNLSAGKPAVLYGQQTYGLAHEECVAAFLDNPSLFINILGVEILEKTYGNPKLEDELFITERACRWNFIGESRFYLGPLRHRADFPLSIKTISTLDTGETHITLNRPTGEIMCTIQLTFSASTRGMTSVHWRGSIDPSAWGFVSPLLGLQQLLRRSPIGLNDKLSGRELAGTLPNAGEDWRLASNAEAPQVINQEAVCQ